MPDPFDIAKRHDEKAQRLRDQGGRRETKAGRTADKSAADWLRDQAGALYAEAAIEFETAAAGFLDAHQHEDAERAYADAAECWRNAAGSWQSPHDKAWAYEMEASDLAAQAAINERDGEFCEAAPLRRAAAASYAAAAAAHFQAANIDDLKARVFRKKAAESTDPAEAAQWNGKADAAAHDAGEETKSGGAASQAGANEAAIAGDDAAKCKR